jgi:hypothetical protein
MPRERKSNFSPSSLRNHAEQALILAVDSLAFIELSNGSLHQMGAPEAGLPDLF